MIPSKLANSRPRRDFFDLPRELRDVIYDSHLATRYNMRPLDDKCQPYDLNILLVSRRTYEEALETLYKTRTFRLTIDPSHLPPLPSPEKGLVDRLQNVEIEWKLQHEYRRCCAECDVYRGSPGPEAYFLEHFSWLGSEIVKNRCHVAIHDKRNGYAPFGILAEGLKYLNAFKVLTMSMTQYCGCCGIIHALEWPQWLEKELESVLGPLSLEELPMGHRMVFHPIDYINEFELKGVERREIEVKHMWVRYEPVLGVAVAHGARRKP